MRLLPISIRIKASNGGFHRFLWKAEKYLLHQNKTFFSVGTSFQQWDQFYLGFCLFENSLMKPEPRKTHFFEISFTTRWQYLWFSFSLSVFVRACMVCVCVCGVWCVSAWDMEQWEMVCVFLWPCLSDKWCCCYGTKRWVSFCNLS